ncbi:MAG: trigger factor [Salinivirgaceae bacterium]|jgi:trigger factor|nr:trigger factor [Salinivirgaceae bacterium]
MNITRENIDELNAVLKVKVEKSDYEKEVENVLKDYRKKATVKGFRPGMVPMGMIKKMYGKAVLLDELNKIISDSLTKHLVDEKLNILGEPLPSESVKSELDFDKSEEFEFAFDIAFAPEFDIKLSKRDKMTYFEIKVDDEMIQQTIDSHAARNGKTEEVDIVEEKDLVKGKYEQLDSEGNVLEGGILTEDALYAVDKIEEDSIRNLVIGAKKDDIVDFDIKKAFSNMADLASMLRIEKDVAEHLEGTFRFTVQSISRHIPAEVNQELFDSVYGESTVSSEKEYKEKIVAEIKESFVSSSDYKLLIDTKDRLVEKAKMTLPDEFLKRWLVAVNKELTKEKVEADYEGMQKDLAWQLIKNKIIEDQEIKVEEAELLEFAKKSVLMQFQQYGMMQIPDEQLETYAKQTLENKEEAQKMMDRKYEEKLIGYLKETIKLDPKEVTTAEFNELFKN